MYGERYIRSRSSLVFTILIFSFVQIENDDIFILPW